MTIFWVVSAIVLAVDRAAKLLAQRMMTIGDAAVVLKGVLELRFTHNTGMALGFLSDVAIAGIILPLLAVVAGVLILRRYRLSSFARCAAGLIFGGFLANFIDRLFLGYVVDMVYFPWLPFFICNVADIAITLGAVLAAVSLLFWPDDWQLKKAEGSADDQNADG